MSDEIHQISGMLSADSRFRLEIHGPINATVLGRIIQAIEMMRDWYAEDEYAEDEARAAVRSEGVTDDR